MVSSYSTDLKLEIMVTGENAGTWGDITNTNLVILQQAIAGYGTVALNATTGATLTFTNGALSDGKNAVIELTGTITGNVSVIIPDGIEKTYLVKNGTSGAFTVQIKTTSGTGPTFAAGDKGIKLVYSNGTDVVDSSLQKLSSDYAPQLSANLDVNGNSIVSTSNANITLTPNGTGDVVLSADTVKIGDANANATITTDGTGDLILNTNSGTNSGSITIEDAANGNITLAPNGIGRITANGETKIFGVFEGATISTTFITSFTYDVLTQAVYFQNVDLGANFTVNMRGDGSNALNAVLNTGESATVALITKQGNTTYYNTSVLVDGTSTNVTVVWQGGSAPTAGNASSNDVYTYTALKTAASTYTVLAAQTQFK